MAMHVRILFSSDNKYHDSPAVHNGPYMSEINGPTKFPYFNSIIVKISTISLSQKEKKQ